MSTNSRVCLKSECAEKEMYRTLILKGTVIPEDVVISGGSVIICFAKVPEKQDTSSAWVKCFLMVDNNSSVSPWFLLRDLAAELRILRALSDKFLTSGIACLGGLLRI